MDQATSGLAVRNLDDLVGLVPYLIGFHPEESLVVVVISEGRVLVTARVDLAPLSGSTDTLSQMLERLFGRYPDARGWFLAYSDDDELAWDVLHACAAALNTFRTAGLVQVGAAGVREDCRGAPLRVMAPSVMAAEATLLGLPARTSRSDLAALVCGPPEDEIAGLLAEFAAREAELAGVDESSRARLLLRLIDQDAPYSLADAARLALLAGNESGQLAVLRRLDGHNAEQQLALWTHVVRHCPQRYSAVPLGLMGMAAWQSGDGALQVVCLERLDRLEPTAPLGAMIDWLNYKVIAPQDWPQLRPLLLGVLAAELAGDPAA